MARIMSLPFLKFFHLFLNVLRILAKDGAVERGYKHVWPVNDRIYVKKTDSSVSIVISTEQDLNNIV